MGVPSKPLQIVEATRDQGWESNKFQLSVVSNSLCGACIKSSKNAFKGLGAGGMVGGGNGLADLVILAVVLAVVWIIGAAWTLFTNPKPQKEEARFQELDPLSAEFLEENRRNFRLSCDEVERVVFTRSVHYYASNSLLPNQMRVQMVDGTRTIFTFSDPQTARALGAQLRVAGFKIENAG